MFINRETRFCFPGVPASAGLEVIRTGWSGDSNRRPGPAEESVRLYTAIGPCYARPCEHVVVGPHRSARYVGGVRCRRPGRGSIIKSRRLSLMGGIASVGSDFDEQPGRRPI